MLLHYVAIMVNRTSVHVSSSVFSFRKNKYCCLSYDSMYLEADGVAMSLHTNTLVGSTQFNFVLVH